MEQNTPTTTVIEVLTQIWQRVLQRSPINSGDNFFDLGGNDSLADSVFAEIAQVCGREFPSATICHAPTIASLAVLLQQPSLPRFSPFVRIRSGRETPPILIAPGLGGRASFSQLAKHIHTRHPIYGIQARGVDGMEEPFERVEDMAEFYLYALNQQQIYGPYILMGYSFGGLLALEMAQRLSQGKQVAQLILMGTYSHPRYFPPGQRLRFIAKRTRHRISFIKQKPGEAFSNFVRALERRSHMVEALHRTLSPETSRLSFAQTILRVEASDLVALARYRPRFYPGKIRFVTPAADHYYPSDPTPLWKGLAAELEVEIVPGDHEGMVDTYFESLAAVLTRYVKEAVDAK
ncbi:MAG: alpha/beta fold hydrolase [Candidatus Sulfotelmatobacter sp.]